MKNLNTIEMLKSVIDDLNKLKLEGYANWGHAFNAVAKISSVISGLEKEQKAKEEAYKASIEDAKARREQAKKEAAERGEEIIGGETINIDLTTGKQTTIIE